MALQQRKNKSGAAAQAAKSQTQRKGKQKHQDITLPSSRKAMFSTSTIQAAMVLIVAAGVGVLWNWYEGSSFANHPNDRLVVQYLTDTCTLKLPIGKDDGSDDPVSAAPNYCNAALAPMGRTHVAKRRISPGGTLLVIPRSRQIWDLDALRDAFVREELLPARHELTQNPLDNGAFLAAYLAMLTLEEEAIPTNHPTLTTPRRLRQQKRHASYLRLLPDFATLSQSHPTLWSLEEEVVPLVGRFSSTYSVVRAYREMMESEYHSLVLQSSLFATLVPEYLYQQMRILVTSRSFGPGPPTSAEIQKQHDNKGEGSRLFHSIDDEMEYYEQVGGVNLTQGCRAMVPILDLYNHHVNHNVDWRYDVKRRAFVAQANAAHGIAAGHEVYDTYGGFTDSHLWARYGFVNGDGSEYTQATIALFHRILDLDLKQQFSLLPTDKTPLDPSLVQLQRRDLTRYLQFDDGYDECVQESTNPQGFAMKRLQLEYLLRIANTPRHWIVRMPSREPNALPRTLSHENTNKTAPVITRRSTVNFKKVVETCRIISMHVDDYNGTAIDVLERALDADTGIFEPPPPLPEDEMSAEFRSLICTGRMAIVALGRFPRSAQEERQLIEESEFQSINWTAAHIRLGEMQTLEVLRGMTFAAARRIKETVQKVFPDSPMPVVRDKPCPWEYTTPLLDEYANDEN
jgi:hypothetical protein